MGVRQILGRILNGGGSGAPIPTGPRVLLYHRVFVPERDPQLLSVSPENFAEQMSWLSRKCTVLPLEELVDTAAIGLPRNAVSITFDDGYFDNLTLARPILEESGVTATMFVSSGFLDSEREMWWDEAEQIFLGESSPSWDVTQPPATDGERAYLSAMPRLKFLSPEARTRELDSLASARGVKVRVRDTHRGLKRDELASLAGDRVLTVGGHTVRHAALSPLPLEDQRREIVDDKRALEAILGARISSFAYPFGTETEFDSETIRTVRDAGYDLACANIPGVVDAGSDRFAIPRVLVRNWDRETFAARMTAWMGM